MAFDIGQILQQLQTGFNPRIAEFKAMRAEQEKQDLLFKEQMAAAQTKRQQVEQEQQLTDFVDFYDTIAPDLIRDDPQSIMGARQKMQTRVQELEQAGRDPRHTKQMLEVMGAGTMGQDFDTRREQLLRIGGLAREAAYERGIRKRPPRAEEPKQTTTEFERIVRHLVDEGTINEQQANDLYLQKAKYSGKGQSTILTQNKDGSVSFITGTGPEAIDLLTSSQKGREISDFKNRRAASTGFVNVSNKWIEDIKERPEKLGLTGLVSRLGDEFTSVAQNAARALNTAGVSVDMNDYDFGSLAAESAASKAVAFDLALMWAHASGLGQGRMSDRDVQNAVNQIGANTNSPEQLVKRLRAIQGTLDDTLQAHADEWGFEYKSIRPELPQDERETVTPAVEVPEGVPDEARELWQDLTEEERQMWLQ
jgi:hypothetical protein